MKTTVNITADSARAEILSGAFRSAFSAKLRRAWSAFIAWRNRRIAIRELQAMPDSLLRDIGIERGQIRAVVFGGGAQTTVLHTSKTAPPKSAPQLQPAEDACCDESRAGKKAA